jgi:myosin heavy subunit
MIDLFIHLWFKSSLFSRFSQISMLQDRPDSLETLLEKKNEECELAASIGQMLLDENQELKKQIENLKSMNTTPGRAAIDGDLAIEIHDSLVQKTRELSAQLQREVNVRMELEEAMENKSKECQGLETKMMQLRKKLDSQVESNWKMSHTIQQLNELLEEKDSVIKRLGHQITHLQDNNESKIAPEPTVSEEISPDNFFAHKRDTASVISFSAGDFQNYDLVDPILNREHCLKCEEFILQCEKLEKERDELQQMLDKSYEAYEALQNESFLSQGSLIAESPCVLGSQSKECSTGSCSRSKAVVLEETIHQVSKFATILEEQQDLDQNNLLAACAEITSLMQTLSSTLNEARDSFDVDIVNPAQPNLLSEEFNNTPRATAATSKENPVSLVSEKLGETASKTRNGHFLRSRTEDLRFSENTHKIVETTPSPKDISIKNYRSDLEKLTFTMIGSWV